MGLLDVIAHHGYAVVALVLFMAAAGLPLPTSIVLLIAGSQAHGNMHLQYLIPLAWLSAVLGDSVLYTGGRYTGWWLLAGMCRLSMNPEGCIFSSSAYFYRRGAKTLLFAKFIPGLASMAAPLAGSLNMRFSRFIRLDMIGVAGYVSTWIVIGYVFSHFLLLITAWVQGVGHAVTFLFLLLAAGYHRLDRHLLHQGPQVQRHPEDLRRRPPRAPAIPLARQARRHRRRPQPQLLRPRHAAHQELHPRRAHAPQAKSSPPSASSWPPSARSTSTAPASATPPASA